MSNKLTPPTIDQLAKGQVGNVRSVIKACSEQRVVNRWHTRGFTGKKTMRSIGEIPLEYYLRLWGCPQCRGYGWADVKHDKGICSKCKGKGLIPNPYYKRYFDTDMDMHYRRKAIHSFLRNKQEFKTVDRI